MVAINSSQARISFTLSLSTSKCEKKEPNENFSIQNFSLEIFLPLYFFEWKKSSSMVSWKDPKFYFKEYTQNIYIIGINPFYNLPSSKNNFYFHLTSNAYSKLHKQQKMLGKK